MKITTGGVPFMEYFEKYLPLLSGWFTDIPKREINNLLIRQF